MASLKRLGLGRKQGDVDGWTKTRWTNRGADS